MRLWLLDASVSAPFDLGSQRWNYHSRLRAQWHQTRLTPQDRFAIGGRHTVRGFDGTSVLSAESGMFLRNELSTQLGASPYSVYLGLDLGSVSGPSAEQLVGRIWWVLWWVCARIGRRDACKAVWTCLWAAGF